MTVGVNERAFVVKAWPARTVSARGVRTVAPLAQALATLPDKQRRAVILFYVADLPVHAIAAQEGVPDGTVKSWLHRGRTALAGIPDDSRTERTDA